MTFVLDVLIILIFLYAYKKVNRKVQGVPQSQAEANQEEDKKDRN